MCCQAQSFICAENGSCWCSMSHRQGLMTTLTRRCTPPIRRCEDAPYLSRHLLLNCQMLCDASFRLDRMAGCGYDAGTMAPNINICLLLTLALSGAYARGAEVMAWGR